MLDRITATFDSLYSPTALAADRQPPAPTARFFGYFLLGAAIVVPAFILLRLFSYRKGG